MLRAALMMILVGTACAPPPAERLHSPRRIDPGDGWREDEPPPPQKAVLFSEPIAVPRPDLKTLGSARPPIPPPDPSDYMRWPLTPNQHPALEPVYAIAPVFAASGVTWLSLCKMGAQNRRTAGAKNEQLDYLRAWCQVARRDLRAAVVQLAPLLRSTVLAIPAAVRIDISNILVDGGDASDAQAVLSAAKVTDIEVYDYLAAAYAEIGKSADAIVLNDVAIDSFDFKRYGDHCKRIVRRVLLAADTERERLIDQLKPLVADRACATLHHEMQCWAGVSCDGYMLDQGADPKLVKIQALYAAWPEYATGPASWFAIAVKAFDQMGIPGADVLATTAIEATMRSSKCAGEMIHDARALAFEIKMVNTHDVALDPRLNVIIDTPKQVCAQP